MRILDVVSKIIGMHDYDMIIAQAASLEYLICLCTETVMVHFMINNDAAGKHCTRLFPTCAMSAWCLRPDMQDGSGHSSNIGMHITCPACPDSSGSKAVRHTCL